MHDANDLLKFHLEKPKCLCDIESVDNSDSFWILVPYQELMWLQIVSILWIQSNIRVSIDIIQQIADALQKVYN